MYNQEKIWGTISSMDNSKEENFVVSSFAFAFINLQFYFVFKKQNLKQNYTFVGHHVMDVTTYFTS